MIKLWSINRVLRWSGVRLFVDVWDGEGERTPTRLGFRWCGLPGSTAWARWEPHNPRPIRAILRGSS